MKNLKLKKAIVILAASYVILTCTASGRDYNPNFDLSQEEEFGKPFATYEDGDIYIGDQTYIDSIKDKVEKDDVLIVDKRTIDDSDMCVLNSYRISDPQDRNTIIEVIQEYEKLYPSVWERTTESMRNEWEIHNILYHLNYKEYRTGHVDLNNEDEEIYDDPVLTKILRN